MTGRLLLVGGGEADAGSVAKRLEDEGFEVLRVVDGAGAIEAISVEKPDLVILDLPAPLLDGLEVCRQIRRQEETSVLPVLMLGREAGELDRIIALEQGADDFLPHPCHPRELIARVRSLLRRVSSAKPARILRAGRLELDPGRYTATLSRRVLRLTAKEFELLRTLMESSGRVIRRERLLEEVWRYGRSAGIQSRTLDVHIRRLRKKLGPEKSRIVTVRNVGYRFDMISTSHATSLDEQQPRG